jgi:hypothetical protein
MYPKIERGLQSASKLRKGKSRNRLERYRTGFLLENGVLLVLVTSMIELKHLSNSELEITTRLEREGITRSRAVEVEISLHDPVPKCGKAPFRCCIWLIWKNGSDLPKIENCLAEGSVAMS